MTLTEKSIDALLKRGETLHLECKTAQGGLPRSLWESYSAFCNTDGGVGITPDGIKFALNTLKESGRIRRVGPDKGGHWSVIRRNMKPGKFKETDSLPRRAESGAPRICYCNGFPGPHTKQCEVSPLSFGK